MAKKLSLTLFILLSLLFCVVPVQAATVPTGFNTWTQQTTTDTRKAWTVNFSEPIDRSSLNNTNIYITDDNNTHLSAALTLSTDGASVQISPSAAYISGNKYWLFITGNITSENGNKQLTQPIALPFLVTASNSTISSVSDSYSSFVTGFTVTTSPDVYSVKINQTSMLYQGNNTYTLGVTGLNPGGKVTVYAYDSNGRLVQSQIYIVN